MEEIYIQTATADDVLELARLARVTYTEAYGGDLDEGFLRNHLENNMSNTAFEEMILNDTFYLAKHNSHLIGFIQIGEVVPIYQDYMGQFDTSASEIRRLYVLSDYQNKGIGSNLIQHAMRDPIVAKTNTIYVTTWEANLGAQRLYRRQGFSKVGQFPEYDKDGELNGYEYVFAKQIRHLP